MKPRFLALLTLLLCTCSLLAVGQAVPNEKLGAVHFPVSCAASQQMPFDRGVALLHDFWYDKAEQQFQQIDAADPTCAIAYWGQAMSLWHQIWDRPSEATMQRGLALVQKGQKMGAKTQRERDYLNALALFYENPSESSFEVRVDAYSNAMEKLHQKYPQDHDAAAFYALSLLAAAPPHDPTFANQKKALAVLNEQFVLAPDNPGELPITSFTVATVRRWPPTDSPRPSATGRSRRRRRTRLICRHTSLRGSACGRRTFRRTSRRWRQPSSRALLDMSCMLWTS